METQYARLCLVFPLIGVLTTPLLARVNPTLRAHTAVGFSLLTAVSALLLLPSLFDEKSLPLEDSYAWLDAPVQIGFGVLLDPLSIVIANVVAVISSFIMVYCLGYMKGDSSRTRFWMLMNGFIGSMLLLVLANDLIFTFIGWKLVGLCSYGLIGYYHRDAKEHWIGGPSPTGFTTPSSNALKALLVTNVGDMLMLAGLLLIYFYSGTLNILALYETVPVWLPEIAAKPGLMVLVTILLIAGPVGKSAQFPLHEWLPEAMSGPGPVSALIHAATMVKSGVFLVARLIPIFYYGYWIGGIDEAKYFFIIVAWVGGITAFLAASQGLVAKELKKILAYSTASQIGYMMLALGVAGLTADLVTDGYTAGIFHLMSHAMFKACLFLCAGTGIDSVHSIYTHEMGGLRRFMPFTWIFMTVAAFSLMGLPPLSGFWSKETVLNAAFGAQHYPLFAIAIVTAVMTAFYTIRFLGMVFHGPPSDHLREAQHHGTHVGEGYRTQTFASGILAVGIILFSVFALPVEHWLHHLFEVSLVQQIPGSENLIGHGAIEEKGLLSQFIVPALSIGALLAGASFAYMLYISRRWNPGWLPSRSLLVRGTYVFLWERWYMDKAFRMVFATGTRSAASVVRRIEVVVDSVINWWTPRSLGAASRSVLRMMQAEAPSLSASIMYVMAIAIVVFLITLPGVFK